MSALRFSVSVASLTRSATASARRPFFATRRALYSTESTSNGPLIRVTDLPVTGGTGHVRILELNRPEARNAISRALLASLQSEVHKVADQYDASGNEKQADGTRALIVASAVDSSFCAGADLKERRSFSTADTEAFLATLRGTLTALTALPIPTIAAVSSVALGGGLELALATHMRVLTSNAVIGLPETRLGIIPGAGGTYRLPMLIGIGRARDLVLTGRRVSAPEAYFMGIADRLVEVDTHIPKKDKDGKAVTNDQGEPEVDYAAVLDEARRTGLSEAVRLAFEICEGGPVAVRAALQAVQMPNESVENKMYERVMATEDRNEALRAFGEKRKPVFQGR